MSLPEENVYINIITGNVEILCLSGMLEGLAKIGGYLLPTSGLQLQSLFAWSRYLLYALLFLLFQHPLARMIIRARSQSGEFHLVPGATKNESL